eukprot:TRINITY_DN50139_c0_g1_i3.p1 TRINITY_DN50139_c0_g1~~TRINITY_DN50139_c0_g1_i3.p1  ORF type:complete len:270 (-),score=36.61 TRINITY_DN50139_c0_g1_i3:177-986(-)
MRVTTLDPVPLSVESVGEDFAIVRWRRVSLDPIGLPQEQRAPTLSFASPLRSPLTNTSSNLSERYEVSVYDEQFGHINTEVATVTRLSGLVLQRKLKHLLPGCLYRVSVKLADLGGCKPLEVVFRTCERLEIHPIQQPDGSWCCSFTRDALPVGQLPESMINTVDPHIHTTPTPLILKFPIEATLEEVPDAPLPHLTGDRAAIHHAGLRKVCYSKRAFTTSMDEPAYFRGLPTHVSRLRFGARQQSLSGEWLSWTYRLIDVSPKTADQM